jgi:hypothetical protein
MAIQAGPHDLYTIPMFPLLAITLTQLTKPTCLCTVFVVTQGWSAASPCVHPQQQQLCQRGGSQGRQRYIWHQRYMYIQQHYKRDCTGVRGCCTVVPVAHDGCSGESKSSADIHAQSPGCIAFTCSEGVLCASWMGHCELSVYAAAYAGRDHCSRRHPCLGQTAQSRPTAYSVGPRWLNCARRPRQSW